MAFATRDLARVLFLSMGLIVCLATGGKAQSNEAWRGQFTLYGWGAGIGGDFTPLTGAPTLSFDKSLSEVLEDLDFAFFATGLFTNGYLAIIADLSHSAASKEGLVPPGVPASGEVTQTSLTFAAGRRVVTERNMTVDLLAGARAWWLDEEVRVPAVGDPKSVVQRPSARQRRVVVV